MVTIFNNLVAPNGDPVSAVVSCRLVANVNGDKAGSFMGDQKSITGFAQTNTDAQGHWELEVVGNDLIQPANTVYEVIERHTGGLLVRSIISVDSDATDPVWIGSVQVGP